MRKIILFSCIFCLAALLLANNYLETQTPFALFGNYSYHARTMALGNAASLPNGFAAGLRNPAQITDEEGFQFYANGTIDLNRENRSFPTFSFFDSYVDDATYMAGENAYSHLQLGWSLQKTFGALVLQQCFGYLPAQDNDYTYEEELRNDGNTNNNGDVLKLGTNEILRTGGVDAYSLGLATHYHMDSPWIPQIGVGLGINLLQADLTHEKKITFTDEALAMAPNAEDYYEKMELSEDALQLRIGANAHVGKHLELTACFMPSYSFEAEDNVTVDTSYSYTQKTTFDSPSRWLIGAIFQPQSILNTTALLEMEFINGDDFAHTVQIDSITMKTVGENVFAFRAGIEHIFPNNIPMRLGFRYQPSYQNKDITQSTFSFGTGFPLGYHFTLDLSAEISRCKFKEEDLFPDSYYNHSAWWDNVVPQDRVERDNVKMTDYQILATLSYHWLW